MVILIARHADQLRETGAVLFVVHGLTVEVESYLREDEEETEG